MDDFEDWQFPPLDGNGPPTQIEGFALFMVFIVVTVLLVYTVV